MQGLRHGLHVAIIMDGNGRWARSRGLSRTAGHREGRKAVRRVVEAAPDSGVTTLTLYAFSADNWKRPADEVAALMDLFETYLVKESRNCAKHGIRLSIIGRRDRLNRRLVRVIERAEKVTGGGDKLHLRIAVDYSSRHAITEAARCASDVEHLDIQRFSQLINSAVNSVPPAPDVDLLIRTSGEKRLSDFLLWECAYAELVFTDRLWPDFDGADLASAVEEFNRRERRYGEVLDAAS